MFLAFLHVEEILVLLRLVLRLGVVGAVLECVLIGLPGGLVFLVLFQAGGAVHFLLEVLQRFGFGIGFGHVLRFGHIFGLGRVLRFRCIKAAQCFLQAARRFRVSGIEFQSIAIGLLSLSEFLGRKSGGPGFDQPAIFLHASVIRLSTLPCLLRFT